jgi:hypothetical protein
VIRFPFWGTRGSLPVELTADEVGARVVAALFGTIGRDLMPIEEIQQYVDNLDLDVRGTFGGHTSCVEIDSGGSDYVPGEVGSGVRLFGRAALTQSRRVLADTRRLEAITRTEAPLHASAACAVSKSHFDHAADF